MTRFLDSSINSYINSSAKKIDLSQKHIYNPAAIPNRKRILQQMHLFN